MGNVLNSSVHISVFSVLLFLGACSGIQQSAIPSGYTPDEQTRYECQRYAVMAKQRYMAGNKPAANPTSISKSWVGSSRTDNGKWAFDVAYRECLAQHAAQQSQ